MTAVTEDPASRRCWSSSSAAAGSTSPATSAPACSVASGEDGGRRHPSYGDYLDYLEVHPDEFVQLFETLLINVTAFFRDPASWERLRRHAPLLAAKKAGEPIRVWSAGCASGQEAYTAAIVFAEPIGPDAFRDRVKIYATDVDLDALNQARQAITPPETEPVPADLHEVLRGADERLAFRKDLRRSVIFGRHDLMGDAPISRLDLLICRNALMYFNAETQARILRPSTSRCPRAASCSSARRRCCSPTATRSRPRPEEAHLRQAAADDAQLARRRLRQRRGRRRWRRRPH